MYLLFYRPSSSPFDKCISLLSGYYTLVCRSLTPESPAVARWHSNHAPTPWFRILIRLPFFFSNNFLGCTVSLDWMKTEAGRKKNFSSNYLFAESTIFFGNADCIDWAKWKWNGNPGSNRVTRHVTWLNGFLPKRRVGLKRRIVMMIKVMEGKAKQLLPSSSFV